jgi:predicted enzyme related to lactoylglutathione lyase
MRGRGTMVPARELRFCFVIDDYEAAAHLYRDVFGLEVLMDLDEQGGRGVILNVPEATLELVDAEHGGMVDDVEVGRRVDDGVRIAVKVDDLQAASRAVTGAGGKAMASPVDTPWGDTNQRFRAKDGMQLTLFQSP